MPEKYNRIVLLLTLLFLTACSAVNFSRSPQTSTDSGNSAEMPLASLTTSPELPVPDGFLTPHPWDRLDDFYAEVNRTNRFPIEIIPDASIYHISLNIPEDLSTSLTGSQAVRYVNAEADQLDKIYFRLFANFHGGDINLENLEVNGKPASSHLESLDTALRVDLDSPLDPGDSLTITFDFSIGLPAEMGGNYGLFGYFDNVLVLDSFYPVIPAYDENGWYAHFPYPNGDNTYQDASYYLVEVSAPQAFVLAATGSEIASTDLNGTQEVVFAAGPARAFYLAGSQEFSVQSLDLDGIKINSYAPAGVREHQQLALLFAESSLKTFEELFGAYPYAEFDVVSSPMQALGIEYPGIIGIFNNLYDQDGTTSSVSNTVMLESVITHEVGHQWFYSVVGNDQQNQPWVDESLTQFVTYLNFAISDQDQFADGLVSNWEARLDRVENQKIPIGLPADRYEGFEYSGIVYGRGPLFFQALEKELGRDTVIAAIRRYFQENQWRNADGEDIQNSLEAECNCDLSQYFEEWIYPAESSGN